MDIQALETWLWDAACAIRGPVDAPKFKDYILPLVFLKRLSDVYDDEIARLVEEFGSRKRWRNWLPSSTDWSAFTSPKRLAGRKSANGLPAWAKRIGVEPREIHLRPMRRKWGSFSSSGRLTFNAEFRRQVIVEELLHLQVPNHGKLFQALRRAYLAAQQEDREDG